MNKGRLNFLVILFLLLFPLIPVWTQTAILSGKICDSKNGELLVGVNVVIAGTTLGTVTDNKGYYLFNKIKPGHYTIRYSFIGYATKELPVDIVSGLITSDVLLEASSIDMNTIVVTGTRTEKSLKDVPVLTQVITSKQFEEMGVSTVAAVLEKTVPGIDFAQYNTRTAITMQGMNARYILFLIDGERMAGEMDGDIDYGRLSLSNVERIEIIKGASSVLYGSNAIGGVINIITKKNTAPLDINVHSRTTKNLETTSGANVGFKKGIISGRSDFVYNTSNGYTLFPDSAYYMTQEKYRSYNANQKLEINPTDKISLSATGNIYQFERFDILSAVTHVHPKYYDYSYGLKGRYYFNPGNNIDASFYSDDYRNVNVQELLNNNEQLKAKDVLQSAKLISNLKPGANQILTLGGEYNTEKLFNDLIEGTRKNMNEVDAYIQEDITFWSKLNIVTGIRASDHSAYGFHAVPKISLMYKLLPVTLRTTFGNGYRAPTLKELYYYFDHSYSIPPFMLLGNPDLKPESSRYLSFSAEYSKTYNNSSISVYRNDISNLITDRLDTSSQYTMMTRKYYNVSSACLYGVDVLSKQKLPSGFVLSGGYSYVYSIDNETKKLLYGTTRNSGNMALEYSFNKKKYQLLAYLQARYVGRKYYGGELSTMYEYDPAFWYWRFSVNQKFHDAISLNFTVDNIFNHINRYSYNALFPGRRYIIGINVNLTRLRNNIKTI